MSLLPAVERLDAYLQAVIHTLDPMRGGVLSLQLQGRRGRGGASGGSGSGFLAF